MLPVAKGLAMFLIELLTLLGTYRATTEECDEYVQPVIHDLLVTIRNNETSIVSGNSDIKALELLIQS